MTRNPQYILSLIFLLAYSTFISCGSVKCPSETVKLNVLFIAIDDMNDWTSLHDPEHPIRVPNLKRLADQGTFFTNAYCNSSACNPSRASVLSGIRPSTSGIYGNASDWKDALDVNDLLPAVFDKNDYNTYCAGKIFHHHGRVFQAYEIFDEYLPFPATRPPDSPMPERNLNSTNFWYNDEGQSLSKVSPNFDWGAWPRDSTQHIDHETVDWAIDRLSTSSEPFFMAIGIFRPHMPFYVPASFLETYPLEDLALPLINPDDLNDLSGSSIEFIKRPWYKWMGTFRHEEKRDSLYWEKAVQAYQASCTYADYQVGRLLDALEGMGLDKNTIIVLWSDHGYHLGEKDHWEKFILYEKTTHVPMIISVPGYKKGKYITSPVSLIDIYPTLTELCRIHPPDSLEGHSLVPLLEGTSLSLDVPAITTYGMNNHAVRSHDYRYIRLADGTEELYHTAEDIHELDNLAADPAYRTLMDSLSGWIPSSNAEPVPDAKRESR